MIWNVIAITIAILSVVITGFIAKLAFKEQKLRLRPWVYVGTTNSKVTKQIAIKLMITNCGLLPAPKVVFLSELTIGDTDLGVTPRPTEPYVLLPNQEVYEHITLTEEETKLVVQEASRLTSRVEINYQGGYYKSSYLFNVDDKTLTVLSADAG